MNVYVIRRLCWLTIQMQIQIQPITMLEDIMNVFTTRWHAKAISCNYSMATLKSACKEHTAFYLWRSSTKEKLWSLFYDNQFGRSCYGQFVLSHSWINCDGSFLFLYVYLLERNWEKQIHLVTNCILEESVISLIFPRHVSKGGDEKNK